MKRRVHISPPPPTLDSILQDSFHGFPKDRLLQQEDPETVRQSLWDAMMISQQQRFSLLDYMMVWCEFMREKGEPRFSFATHSCDSFVFDVCRYFGLSRASFAKLTRDEMRQLSTEGLGHGLERHVAFMSAWEEQTHNRATTTHQVATINKKNKVPRKLPRKNATRTPRKLAAATKPTSSVARLPLRAEEGKHTRDLSGNDDVSPEETQSSPVAERGSRRPVKPKRHFDPTDLGRSWSEYGQERDAKKKPRHQLLTTAAKKYSPRSSMLLLDPTKLGTQPGVFEPGSLWKYVRREDGQTYIVEVAKKGKVSKQGKIEVHWKGYRKTSTPHRLFAADLQCASPEDLETFQSIYLAARAGTTWSSVENGRKTRHGR